MNAAPRSRIDLRRARLRRRRAEWLGAVVLALALGVTVLMLAVAMPATRAASPHHHRFRDTHALRASQAGVP